MIQNYQNQRSQLWDKVLEVSGLYCTEPLGSDQDVLASLLGELSCCLSLMTLGKKWKSFVLQSVVRDKYILILFEFAALSWHDKVSSRAHFCKSQRHIFEDGGKDTSCKTSNTEAWVWTALTPSLWRPNLLKVSKFMCFYFVCGDKRQIFYVGISSAVTEVSVFTWNFVSVSETGFFKI